MFPLISTFFVIALIPITVASNLMMESIQDTTDLSWKYSAAFARSRSSYKRVLFIGGKRSNVQMLPQQIFKMIQNVCWMIASLTCCQLLNGKIEITTIQEILITQRREKRTVPYNKFCLQMIVISWIDRPLAKKIVHTTIVI